MHGIDHKYEILLDHLDGTTLLTLNAPYYNNYEYYEDDPNESHEFDFDNYMENLDLSHSIYGYFNSILNLIVVVENIFISFWHVTPIIFHHMDPTMFQSKWNIFMILHVPIQSSNILSWLQYAFGCNGNDYNN